MHCPSCSTPTLEQRLAQQGTLVDVCSQCQGLWLDRGEILEFSDQPSRLEERLEPGLGDPQPSDHLCPRCHRPMERGVLADLEAEAEQCPGCRGLWFTAREVRRLGNAGGLHLEAPEEPEGEADEDTRAAAHERLERLAAGLLALPNLVLRSTLTLALLYGLLTLVLITVSVFGYLSTNVALIIGVSFALVQFTLGPWILDLCLRWLYRFRWLPPEQLPEHLREFVARVCAEQRMRFPSVGLIDDGAPTAFTYGHHPGNARVVISRGLLELLEPAEVEAVVAHELGHARNWDMALMTMANLVPLLLFFLYRFAVDRGKDKGWIVGLGAYVVYIVSEYIVLWFSRTREYYADRFAGQVTGNPNALATALVKIAYGLAAQKGVSSEKAKDKKEEKARLKEKARAERIAALGPMNIFDKNAAVALVMGSASRPDAGTSQLDPERVKGAMQWDLWNPWATYYEIHSTHPLVAKRLRHLTDQAAHQGQEPFIVFDRQPPESYWDEFLTDVSVLVLPTACFLLGLAAFLLTGLVGLGWNLAWLAGGVGVAGLASLAKTRFAYRPDFFPHLSVAGLLHKVKVSAVRPVPVTLTGTIIGKGVPGLVWSEDFVLQDRTGILFIDYRQPFAIWNFLFGLFRAGRYQGKEVRVTGWFRRSPVPYLELNRLEVLDGSERPRRCYTYVARLLLGGFLAVAGFAVLAALLLA
jgi:Zn-dependent protease with chaperone function/Zn-finger nucleic acid-binding protein